MKKPSSLASEHWCGPLCCLQSHRDRVKDFNDYLAKLSWAAEQLHWDPCSGPATQCCRDKAQAGIGAAADGEVSWPTARGPERAHLLVCWALQERLRECDSYSTQVA
ncbi:hypothetical protein HaLaN_19471 [Haematococcus lacustris]|uniref:Uncharacterized protein n=1 Tax=Haematococcus lacustris TaxID=44745 RepID=A0A699ZJA0_HAELA|nr:hypothetical protein HaLaN_19471 [Haematococcus lacustris]